MEDDEAETVELGGLIFAAVAVVTGCGPVEETLVLAE